MEKGSLLEEDLLPRRIKRVVKEEKAKIGVYLTLRAGIILKHVFIVSKEDISSRIVSRGSEMRRTTRRIMIRIMEKSLLQLITATWVKCFLFLLKNTSNNGFLAWGVLSICVLQRIGSRSTSK